MTEPGASSPQPGYEPAEGESQVDHVTFLIETLFDAHDRLEAQVSALKAAAGSASNGNEPEPATDWAQLDEDQTAQLLEVLTDWVEWLTDRFRLAADLPKCWVEHPDLLEELSALRSAHTWAYGPNADGSDGLRWLESLDRARERWGRWNTSKCTRAQHREPATLDVRAVQVADRDWSHPSPLPSS
jgi:hypothetical protein